jgi:hypothetical protein
MNNQEKNTKSIKDIKVDDLKNFVSTIQKEQVKKDTFKPERLQNMRDNGNFSRKYSSGLTN